jgi:hypothetical protein
MPSTLVGWKGRWTLCKISRGNGLRPPMFPPTRRCPLPASGTRGPLPSKGKTERWGGGRSEEGKVESTGESRVAGRGWPKRWKGRDLHKRGSVLTAPLRSSSAERAKARVSQRESKHP